MHPKKIPHPTEHNKICMLFYVERMYLYYRTQKEYLV